MSSQKSFIFSAIKDSSEKGPAVSLAPEENKFQKRRKLEELNKRYQSRVTIARLGQESMAKKDYMNAIKYYNQYLKIIADIHEVEIYELSTALFGPRDTSEKLLISHIFWDLCRICDLSPHLKGELQRNLTMFVVFTANQPFQALNSEMIRRNFQKGKVRNRDIFEEAFKKIQVNSKKCFIATYSLGNQHWATEQLRSLKQDILQFHYGSIFVHFYYSLSSRTVKFLESRPIIGRVFSSFTRPLLIMLGHIHRLVKMRF